MVVHTGNHFTPWDWKRYLSGGDKVWADSVAGLSSISEAWDAEQVDFMTKLLGGLQAIQEISIFSQLSLDFAVDGHKPNLQFTVNSGDPEWVKNIIDRIRGGLPDVTEYDWPSWMPTFEEPETGIRRLSVQLLDELRKALGISWTFWAFDDGYATDDEGGLAITHWVQQRYDDGAESYNDIKDSPTISYPWEVSASDTIRWIHNTIVEYDFTSSPDLLLSGDWHYLVSILASPYGAFGSGWGAYDLNIGVYESDPSSQTVQERYQETPTTILKTWSLSSSGGTAEHTVLNVSDYVSDGVVRLKVWATDTLPPFRGSSGSDSIHSEALVDPGLFDSLLPIINSYVLLMPDSSASGWRYD